MERKYDCFLYSYYKVNGLIQGKENGLVCYEGEDFKRYSKITDRDRLAARLLGHTWMWEYNPEISNWEQRWN